MICSLCSLLCDQPAFHSSCKFRAHALSESKASTGGAPLPFESSAKDLVRTAKTIHIAGRFHCVETCRAAIDVARALPASIDGSHPSSMFEVAQAVAGSGAYLCSLAEARSLSDCLIIINSAGLLQQFPQLPAVLNRHFLDTQQPTSDQADRFKHIDAPKSLARVVLLGPDCTEQAAYWEEHFAKVMVCPCSIEAIPSMLLEIEKAAEPPVDRQSSQNELTDFAWQDTIASSRYPVVVWGSGSLPVPEIDFWGERLQTWLLRWNEHSRASGLILSSLANVFHHTCTWLTGYPSRLDFTKGDARWERQEASTERWLNKYRGNEDACLIWIDESTFAESVPKLLRQSGDRFRMVELTASAFDSGVDEVMSTSSAIGHLRTRIGRPGVDYPATLLRSDQIVMAYPDSDPALRRERVLSAASWLRGLLD
ncbi:hypothetical protein SH501x_000548 [Pirellulaceae bacterium SH501]